MVFDWFRRSVAPDADDATGEPPLALTEPGADSARGSAAVGPSGVSPSGPAAAPAPGSETAEASAEPQAPAMPPAIGAVDQAALDWARQAYARLKAQQAAAAAPVDAALASPVIDSSGLEAEAPLLVGAADAPAAQVLPAVEPDAAPLPIAPVAPESAPEPLSPLSVSAGAAAAATTPPTGTPATDSVAAPAAGLSLLERAAAQRQQRLQEITAAPAATAVSPVHSPAPAPVESEPQLGAFDDTFTWSAEVLAAQGRRVEEISLEEIDWLARLRRGLEKTRRSFVSQLLENLGDDPLTPEVLDDLETTLLRADVGVQATDQVLDALRRRLNQEVVDPVEGLRFLKQQLRDLLDRPVAASTSPLLVPQRDRLNIWLLVGVNGVGKTTTLGKLANLAMRSGYSCLIAAADTFRAAAVQQVQVWGERSGVPVVANATANADPAAVVFDAIGAARSRGTELVLVDTAGRLQTKHNLMEELSKVRRIIDRLAPEAAVESLLVLDASQGQNGLRQAMAFASAAGLTGVVITKLDGSARGGVALAVASEAQLPIRFIGAGEGIRDLRPFNSFEFVEALLAG